MPKQVKIKPDETRRLLDDILSSSLTEPVSVESVTIDIEARTMTVTISSEQCPPRPELERISAAIEQKLGMTGATVRMRWKASGDCPRLEDFVRQNHGWLRQSISELVPALRAVSSHIEFVTHGENCLEIRLPNAVLAARASRKHFRESLMRAVSECLGRRVLVRVSQAECDLRDDDGKDLPVPEQLPDKSLPPPADISPVAPCSAQVVLGRHIAAQPVPVKNLQDNDKNVVIQGEAFGVEYRVLRNGTHVVVFGLCDGEDSISVKVVSKSQCVIKEGAYLKVRGDVSYDKYIEEIALNARDIVEVERPAGRVDSSVEKRVELHLHTKMSSMDSVLDLEQAMKTLKLWGHTAVAITDHGVVQAFPQAHELSEQLGIKVIYGVEGYMVETGDVTETPYHVVLLALDSEGLRQIYRLVTTSHLEHFYKRPRMLRSEIAANRSHLLVGSACESGEIYRKILAGANQDELLEAAAFYDYLEIQPLANNMFLVDSGKCTVDDLVEFNRRIYALGKSLGKPVVAAGDVHFLHPEDSVYRKVLIMAQGFENAERDSPLWLRTTDEMLKEFEYLGEDGAMEVVIRAPQAIASHVSEIKPVPSGFYAPVMPGAAEELERTAWAEAKRLYGDPLPEPVRVRLERELRAITGGGFASIYAICRKLVERSQQDGYLVGSRGSVGSSFVARLIGITEVNPLDPHYRCPACKYSEFDVGVQVDSGFDLPPRKCPRCGSDMDRDGHRIAFEVFMGFKGDKVPDIDLNFSGENQAAIIKYAEELLGKGNVFRAGTIATVADRTAFGLVKAYCEASGIRLKKAEMARLARGITGVKRTTGQHPGGVLVLPAGKDIFEFTPLQHPADDRKSGTVTTHFDYDSISSRLVKMDILGHDDPTALRMLQDYTGIDPRSISFQDPDTMSIFSSTEALGYKPDDIGCPVGTIGIPEFGTKFVRQMLAETRPKDFSGLVRISGLSHGTDVWLNNAQDLIKNGIARLADVICARDDILNYLTQKNVRKDVAFRIMENVRKGKGLSPDDQKIMEEAGVPGWYIESCRKIKYLFPKAHAVAYVMMAFRIAYFKVHMPEAFYAQYFTLRTEDLDLAVMLSGPGAMLKRCEEIESKGPLATAKEKDQAIVLEVACEMYLRGIGLLGVSLYESDATRFKIRGNKLLPPFIALPGMGQAAARNLVEARRDGPFLSVEDLRQRARLQRNLVDLLRRFGCLEGLPECNQMVLL